MNKEKNQLDRITSMKKALEILNLKSGRKYTFYDDKSARILEIIPLSQEGYSYCCLFDLRAKTIEDLKRGISNDCLSYCILKVFKFKEFNNFYSIKIKAPLDVNDYRSRTSITIKEKIYFIQSVSGGPIKIGVSNSPKNRLKDIQLMCPYKLNLLATIKGDRKKEQLLHRKFKKYRLHGEWFEDNNEIKKYINKIK